MSNEALKEEARQWLEEYKFYDELSGDAMPHTIIQKLLTALEESERQEAALKKTIATLEQKVKWLEILVNAGNNAYEVGRREGEERIKALEKENANYNSNWVPPNMYTKLIEQAINRSRRETAEEMLKIYFTTPLNTSPEVQLGTLIAAIRERFMEEKVSCTVPIH